MSYYSEVYGLRVVKGSKTEKILTMILDRKTYIEIMAETYVGRYTVEDQYRRLRSAGAPVPTPEEMRGTPSAMAEELAARNAAPKTHYLKFRRKGGIATGYSLKAK